MSFIRLARERGAHYVEDYRSARFSPVYDHLLEIEARLTSIDLNGPRRAPLHIPMSDFATFPIGSRLGAAGKCIKVMGERRRSRRRLQFTGVREVWTVDRQLSVAQARGSPGRLAWNQPVSVLLAHDQSGKEVGVSASGLFQFHCAAFSHLLDVLSVAWRRPEAVLQTLFVDADQTDLLQDKTLIMSPTRAFLSNTALLQLALFLTDSVMRDYLLGTLRRLHLQLIDQSAAIFSETCPAEVMECTIESEVTQISRDSGTSTAAEFCERIVADHREPKFKSLIVKLPQSDVDEQIRSLADLAGFEPPPTMPKFVDKTRIGRNPHVNHRSIRIAKLSAEFGRLMPGFRQVAIQREHRRAAYLDSSPPQHPPGTRKRDDFALPEASVAPPGPGTGVPYIRHVPTPTSIRPFARPASPEAFLAASDEPGLVPIEVEFDRLPQHMIEFLHAAYKLYDHVALDALPPHLIVRGQERLFVVPPEWGRFSRVGSDNVPRLVAAVPLRLDGGVVWVIEIMRRHPSESFATGFCLPQSYDDGLAFLGRLLRTVSRRYATQRGDDPHGTWPRSDYSDVRLDSLRHSSAPGRTTSLSDILLSRALGLLSPASEF